MEMTASIQVRGSEIEPPDETLIKTKLTWEYRCQHSERTWVMEMNQKVEGINNLIYVHQIQHLALRLMIYLTFSMVNLIKYCNRFTIHQSVNISMLLL